MQFFFHGLLVAAITYFLKLGHNNHGLHIYCSYHGPPTGRRNIGPSTGRRNNGPSMGRRNSGPSIGRRHNGHSTGSIINGPIYGPYDRLAKHGPITDRIMAVKRLELESSIHGPTITDRR